MLLKKSSHVKNQIKSIDLHIMKLVASSYHFICFLFWSINANIQAILVIIPPQSNLTYFMLLEMVGLVV
jgi:hypothetical protein